MGSDPVRRPPGILWDHLDDVKAASIPTLARMRSA
jgi:hypothetical protein